MLLRCGLVSISSSRSLWSPNCLAFLAPRIVPDALHDVSLSAASLPSMRVSSMAPLSTSMQRGYRFDLCRFLSSSAIASFVSDTQPDDSQDPSSQPPVALPQMLVHIDGSCLDNTGSRL